MDWTWLDHRPQVVALAGPNGAGKTTFYNAFLRKTGLPFVNADLLAREYGLAPYAAADAADVLRRTYVAQNESFIFETVLSDPVGHKVDFLREIARSGFRVVMCFIAIRDAHVSEQRVSMRVAQGGHDVPTDKLQARFSRTMRNLRHAIEVLPAVLIFDNNDLANPYREVACFQGGVAVPPACEPPPWLAESLSHAPA